MALIGRGIHEQIFAANRTPIVWEEMLLVWNVTLDKDVLVQVWQSAANAKLVTQAGYQVPLKKTRRGLTTFRHSSDPTITGTWTADEDNGLILDLQCFRNSTPFWITAIPSRIGD